MRKPSPVSFRALAIPFLLLGSVLAFAWMASRPRHSASPLPLQPVALQGPQRIPGGLEGGVDWINTAGPIHLEDLKGKLVLLDFWTYCCINCHHILPDLEYLEKKYPNELVVIGVHTGKFPAEKDTDNIRKKVAEYKIQHPVINDANEVLWNRFFVSSWPTLVLLDANGNYVGSAPGEGNRDILDKAIQKLIDQHKARNELDTTPLHFLPEVEKHRDSPLLYPGKILVDPESKRIFITDTGHNRIVVTDISGKQQAVIGSGAVGFENGSFEKAQFNRPQGLCLSDGILYVADVENHAIRACDLESKQVKTVAGDGKQSYRREGGGKASETGLSSPWDLVQVPNTKVFLIAMAGTHQLWKLDLARDEVSVWAGTGREDIIDGPIESACFAQPSGLATDGQTLWVADSEGSTIRSINLEGKKHVVSTVAGPHDMPRGMTLFAFGDRDGKAGQAQFQHCLGLSYEDGKVYVADTYNNKIKTLDPKTRTVKTLAGSRQAGSTDKPPQFDEPGGVSAAGTNLFVADTNNQAVRIVSLTSGEVTTLALSGVEPPRPAATRPKFPNATQLAVEPATVAPGEAFALDVTLKLPEGFKINPEAPMPILLEAPDDPSALGPDSPSTGLRLDPPRDRFEVEVPLAKEAKAGDKLSLKLSVSAFECKEGAAGLCRIKNYVWTIPVQFASNGGKTVPLTNAEKEE